MTKIKNTKKGMAKKTLSMSLVVAMLATSNVPVWAAEFSDGTEAAFTSEAEAPVAEAEAPVAEEEVAAPVVEDTENTEDTVVAQKAEGSYYVSGLEQAASVDWKGNTFDAKGNSVDANNKKISLVKGTIYDAATGKKASGLSYVWRVDGAWVKDAASIGNDLSTVPLPTMTKDTVGKKLELCLVETKDADGEPVYTVDFGTVKAVDISKDSSMTFSTVTFDGTEKKVKPSSFTSTSVGTLNADDFDWSYSGTNGIIKAGSKVTVTATAKATNKSGITGTVTGEFTIQSVGSISADAVKVSLKDAAKTYTYTGSQIEVPVADVTITYKDTTYDLSSYVKTIKSTGVAVNEDGYDTVQITFDDKKLVEDGFATSNNTALNVKLNGTAKVKVTKLNLVDCTVKSLKSYTTAPASLVYGKDYVIVKDGKELALTSDVTAALASKADDYKNPQVYSNALVITGTGTNVTGTAYGSLTITTRTFDNATFKDSMITLSENEKGSFTVAMDYTGKAPTYGMTVAGVKTVLGGLYGTSTDATPLSSTSYDVTFENVDKISTGTQLAKVTVTGKNEFQGCTKTFYFKIVPATVKADATTGAVNSITTKTTDGVEQNDAYTSASDYKDAIGLAIAASAKDPVEPNNTKKNISLPLTEGTDYTVTSYKFTDKSGNDWVSASKSGDKYVQIKANITTDKVTVTAGTAEYGKAKTVIATLTSAVPAQGTTAAKPATLTLYVKVNNKSLSTANVTLDKDVYTYTGKEIVPNVTVTYGGKILEKDKDYIVTTSNSKDAGSTAKVTVTGIGEFGGSIEKSFTIEKANVANLTVALKNTATLTYNGAQQKPELTNFDIKLGDNTLTDFAANKDGYAVTYGTNVNAGEKAGTLTITATDKNKNFTGSVDVKFDIAAQALTASNSALNIYNEYGKKLTGTLPALEWTGSAVTFAKADVDLTKVNGKPSNAPDLTTNDVEVVYVNNVDKTTGDLPAYIALVGKGNYTGAYSVVKKDGKITVELTATVEAANKKTAGTYEVLQSGVLKDSYSKVSINGSVFTSKDITVNDGVYAGGLSVAPVVNVTRNGKTLVEGTDYKVEFVDASADRVNVTGKAIKVKVVGLGQYNGTIVAYGTDGKELTYKVAKKDLNDCFVKVIKNEEELTTIVMNGNVTETAESFEVKDNGDGTATVSVVNDGKNYTGSKTVTIEDPSETGAVGTAVISEVKVEANKATVVLEDSVENATGYDYVISTSDDPTDTASRVDVVKNQIKTEASFTYVQEGTYYAYCHAWKRGKDGKKVFGDWSNVYSFTVSETTPEQPAITRVKVNGSTVTVTYTKSADAAGYDVVLGTALKKVAGEKRPVEYGTLVKKNIKGDKVTATFKNVPAGTYYAGLHAYTRSEETNKKVFSPWSDAKKVTVK